MVGYQCMANHMWWECCHTDYYAYDHVLVLSFFFSEFRLLETEKVEDGFL